VRQIAAGVGRANGVGRGVSLGISYQSHSQRITPAGRTTTGPLCRAGPIDTSSMRLREGLEAVRIE
jgi:hypothetical protein